MGWGSDRHVLAPLFFLLFHIYYSTNDNLQAPHWHHAHHCQQPPSFPLPPPVCQHAARPMKRAQTTKVLFGPRFFFPFHHNQQTKQAQDDALGPQVVCMSFFILLTKFLDIYLIYQQQRQTNRGGRREGLETQFLCFLLFFTVLMII